MPDIEYFYSAHSAFAYIGSARLMEIARHAGCRIVHKPMDLGLVMAQAGSSSFAERSRSYRDYYFGREIERWSEWRNAPTMQGLPANHRGDMSLCNGLVIAALQGGHNVDLLAHELLQAHWRDNADLADRAVLAQAVLAVGFDPESLLDAAGSPGVQALYQANTEEAIQRCVFGSPTYFVDGDMFYGQDHLELVERALKQPFAGAWPRIAPA